ncbi:B12-binding domain-containing radical SAM protein [Gimesia sp.]|uniref:B12-binding domain-containing radical SAM protein n=1 Tax=Gimesia sp. TaxID=2024833 RepID=UPI003A8FD42B
MKILLINPPAENTVIENPNEEGEEFLEGDDFGDFPPLGALYVLTHCEKHTTGHEFFFLDCVGERISHKRLRPILEEMRPDIVGVTSFTISLVDVCMVADLVRDINPQAHICLGGHHPIAYPFAAAQLPQFDSIIVGEGELAFTDLVKALEKGEDFTAIRGVYTDESIQKYVNNPHKDKRFLARIGVPSAYVEEIDSIPFPDRRYLRHIKYQNILGVTSDLATILSSRGCPYKCTFCDVPIKSYRQRDDDAVLDEVEECLALGYTEFRFYDDLFNINEKKILSFCDAIERRGLKFTWDFRGRVNAVTRESLIRAKKVGLRMIAFGVETGSDEGLAHLRKATTTTKVKNAFRWCRELGILTVADFIIGLPTEKTPIDVKRNIDFLIKLDPDYAQLSILTLYPNTEIFDQAVAKGLAKAERWQEWALDPKPGFVVDHWEEHLSHAEIVKLQKSAYRRFYFRPKYLLRSAMKTRSLYEFSAKAGGALKLMRTNKRSA